MQNRSDSCDFCFFAPPPYWAFPATDFVMTTVGSEDHTSHGGWLACTTCRSFIERGDLDGLVEYVSAGYIARGQSWDPELSRELRRLWRMFLEHRDGEPRLLDDERAECEHPEEARGPSTRNDRVTGEQYVVVTCGLCGQEFPDLLLPEGEMPPLEGEWRIGGHR